VGFYFIVHSLRLPEDGKVVGNDEMFIIEGMDIDPKHIQMFP
jgi:hypothetical protein